MAREQHLEKERAKRKRQRPLKIFIAGVMIIAIAGGVWVYQQYQARISVNQAAEIGQDPEKVEAFNKQLLDSGAFGDGSTGILGGENIGKEELRDLIDMASNPDKQILKVTCKPGEDISKPEYALNGITVEERPKVFDLPELYYNGKHYKRNTAVKAYLILGIDTDRPLKEDFDSHDTGRSDGIFLLAHDTAKNQVTIIQVPRDTMCDMYVTDYNYNILRIGHDHLTLAWWMGDNHELSGKLATTAVSWLFGGLPIDGYMAGPAGIINRLNDFVGGVTVEVPDDSIEKADPVFKKGARVDLQGELAEMFVRWRDTDVAGSPISRMDRQRIYAIAFEKKLISEQKKDKDTVPQMFQLLDDNIITNMEKGTYLDLALEILMKDDPLSESSFITPKGDIRITEYDEFWPDYMDIDKSVLNIFYREV
ncbi:LCP family protein [Oribacterium sp. P6A1]|uniref:LCP family protein n=1 Tax=Oribacterium sp. P6A1 TaxID=1410612 RepID=UPI00069196F6|nr:LCP family protein [Oribacterium sp. P6A1]